MGAIFGFIKHTLVAMFKGFVFTGVITAAICIAVLLATSPAHQLVMGLAAVFAIVISVLAAFLGSAVALIYHLSHIQEIHHVLQRVSTSTREQSGEPTRAK